MSRPRLCRKIGTFSSVFSVSRSVTDFGWTESVDPYLGRSDMIVQLGVEGDPCSDCRGLDSEGGEHATSMQTLSAGRHRVTLSCGLPQTGYNSVITCIGSKQKVPAAFESEYPPPHPQRRDRCNTSTATAGAPKSITYLITITTSVIISKRVMPAPGPPKKANFHTGTKYGTWFVILNAWVLGFNSILCHLAWTLFHSVTKWILCTFNLCLVI